jgi:Transposase DDE domain group 1
VLDVDDTFDAVHGEQQLRLFNAHYDEYGFQPIVVFDGEGRPVTAMLRPARRPSGREACAFLRRLVREIRGHWPRVEILIRADSHYCAPEVLDFCRAEGLDFILGVASTTTLRRHVEALEQSTATRRAAMPGTDKLRRYMDGAGSSGSSPASRPAPRGPIPASSSPTCPAVRHAPSTRGPTASADRLKIT